MDAKRKKLKEDLEAREKSGGFTTRQHPDPTEPVSEGGFSKPGRGAGAHPADESARATSAAATTTAGCQR